MFGPQSDDVFDDDGDREDGDDGGEDDAGLSTGGAVGVGIFVGAVISAAGFVGYQYYTKRTSVYDGFSPTSRTLLINGATGNPISIDRTL